MKTLALTILVDSPANIYTAVTLLTAVFFYGCSSSPVLHELKGDAQGTTYTIKYTGNHSVTYDMVDSVLESMDVEMNSWRQDSRITEINKFNRTDTVFAFYDNNKIWSVMWDLSLEINRHSDGAFDPTVMPLVDLWGFNLKKVHSVDSSQVDSVMEFIGFRTDLIDFKEVENDKVYVESHIIKGDPRSKVDFNAIAQGYTVDMLHDLLVENGVKNSMVELGGEVKCQGLNTVGKPWSIAVDKPIASGHSDRELGAIIPVVDASVCTSGNYRKFVEVDGVKRSHSIDPRTGYPVDHSLLSVTIKASSAAVADAYATACMVLGPEEGAYFIEERMENAPQCNIDAFFILASPDGYEYYITPGWSEEILVLD